MKKGIYEMKKKIIYPILSTFLLLSLAACSSEEADVLKEEKAPRKGSRRSKQTTEVQPAHWSYEGRNWSGILGGLRSCKRCLYER